MVHPATERPFRGGSATDKILDESKRKAAREEREKGRINKHTCRYLTLGDSKCKRFCRYEVNERISYFAK